MTSRRDTSSRRIRNSFRSLQDLIILHDSLNWLKIVRWSRLDNAILTFWHSEVIQEAVTTRRCQFEHNGALLLTDNSLHDKQISCSSVTQRNTRILWDWYSLPLLDTDTRAYLGNKSYPEVVNHALLHQICGRILSTDTSNNYFVGTWPQSIPQSNTTTSYARKLTPWHGSRDSSPTQRSRDTAFRWRSPIRSPTDISANYVWYIQARWQHSDDVLIRCIWHDSPRDTQQLQ